MIVISSEIEEIWKDIEGYEGSYQISNLGRVKSLKRKVRCGNGYTIVKEKILKQSTNHKGYKTIRINKNDKKSNLIVHRLVAKAFIENPLNKPQVNHIDGNKQNNVINNLEWNTQSENSKHAYKMGLNSCKLKLDNKNIIKLYQNHNIGYTLIAKELSVSPSAIRRVLVENDIRIRTSSEVKSINI